MADVKNIHQRLAAAMGEVSYVQKERKDGMKYTIVSHDKVTALVRPVLLKNGIVYYPVRCEHLHNGNRAECSMTVRFVNVDEPADFFDVPSFGYGIDPQDKGPGKAMSYAVKYALLKALGLETGDDPEADSIDHTREDPAAPPPAPPKSKQEKTPASVRDFIKGEFDKAQTYADVAKIMSAEKIKELREWLYLEDEPKSKEVDKAEKDALARVDPGYQSPPRQVA